ncbi:hypothetical protein [Xanthobacter sediminis]
MKLAENASFIIFWLPPYRTAIALSFAEASIPCQKIIQKENKGWQRMEASPAL